MIDNLEYVGGGSGRRDQRGGIKKEEKVAWFTLTVRCPVVTVCSCGFIKCFVSHTHRHTQGQGI